MVVVTLALASIASAQLTQRQQQMAAEVAHPTDQTIVPNYPTKEVLRAIQRDFLLLPRPIEAQIIKEGGNAEPPSSRTGVAGTMHVELVGAALAFKQRYSYGDTLIALYGYIQDEEEDMDAVGMLYGMTNMAYYSSSRLVSFPVLERKTWVKISTEKIAAEKRLLSEKVRNEIHGQFGSVYGGRALERLLQTPPLLHRKDIVGDLKPSSVAAVSKEVPPSPTINPTVVPQEPPSVSQMEYSLPKNIPQPVSLDATTIKQSQSCLLWPWFVGSALLVVVAVIGAVRWRRHLKTRGRSGKTVTNGRS